MWDRTTERGSNTGGAADAFKLRGTVPLRVRAPRHFLYPSLLLLLAEEPRHGYRLVDSLLRLGFGPVDRPSVYRALGELEADGLLHSWETSSTAGSPRHVYGVTDAGHRQLDRWMAVVADERDALQGVLKRYDTVALDGD